MTDEEIIEIAEDDGPAELRLLAEILIQLRKLSETADFIAEALGS